MISNPRGDIIVDGVTMNTQPIYKCGESSIANGIFYVLGDDGILHEATPIAVYDTPIAYILSRIPLVSGNKYTISGVCAPVGTTVHITPANMMSTVSDMKKNVIASVVSDEDGNFSMVNVECTDGEIVVWITVDIEYVQTAYITCTAEHESDDATEPEPELVQQTIILSPYAYVPPDVTAPYSVTRIGNNSESEPESESESTCPECGYPVMECECGSFITTCPWCRDLSYDIWSNTCSSCGYGSPYYGWTEQYHEYPRYTIEGACPTNINELYLSVVDKFYKTEHKGDSQLIDETYSFAELASTVTKTYISDDGNFRFDLSSFNDEVRRTSKIVIWARTGSDEGITITNITCNEDANACLSGDTLITMTDGTHKRMDEIQVGDLVLSRNMTPTRVFKIGRGEFNTRHTLYAFEDGTIIDETHEHRFFNVEQGFYQRLQNWEIGDRAISHNGSYVALVSVEQIDEKAEMFGIWTEDGTYYANGLLSGAATCNEPLLANATADQVVDMIMSVEERKLLQLFDLGGALP